MGIVKRTPFTVRLAVQPDSPLLFTNANLDCVLLYDVDSKKEVEAPNVKPLEWVCKPSNNGTQATVEFRVNVLTTQHQQNLFIIKIQLRAGAHCLQVFTKPIKSVSKPEQVRRRIPMQPAEDLPVDLQPVVGASSSKKRARSEELLSTLADIKLKQQQQTQMLSMLLSQQTSPLPPKHLPVVDSPPTLDVAVTNLLLAYSAMTDTERPLKLRRVAPGLNPQQRQLLT